MKVVHHRVLLKDRSSNVIKDDPQEWADRAVRSVVLRKIGKRGLTMIPHGACANPIKGAGCLIDQEDRGVVWSIAHEAGQITC